MQCLIAKTQSELMKRQSVWTKAHGVADACLLDLAVLLPSRAQ